MRLAIIFPNFIVCTTTTSHIKLGEYKEIVEYHNIEKKKWKEDKFVEEEKPCA